LQTQEIQTYSAALQSDGSSKNTLGAPVHLRVSSADDLAIGRSENLGRYRRRSVGAIEPSSMAGPMVSQINTPAPTWAAVAAGREKGRLPQPMPQPSNSLARPTSFHSRQESHDSSSSAGSNSRPASVCFLPLPSLCDDLCLSQYNISLQWFLAFPFETH
jgi:hypothetical protein